MGVTPSVDLNIQYARQLNYFAVQMGYVDRFRLILAPEEIVNATELVLRSTWPIQKIYKKVGFVEFKLEGRPWYTIGEENLNVKYFMCSILQNYYGLGWYLKASTDMQRNSSDTNVLFFHKEIPSATSVICVSLNSHDKMRILGPENVYQLVRQSVASTWPRGIQREQKFGMSYEIKLHGYPWTDWARDSTESFAIPIMMCEIMSNLFRNGWVFAAAIDTGKSQQSLNALYFRYAPETISESELKNTNFFALSLNKSDRLRLHRATPDLVSIMTSASYGVPSLWLAGIQEQCLINNALEFKLKGNPWLSNQYEAVESRRLISNIFNLLSRYGWNLYATCDLTKHMSNKSTFFFRTKPIEPKSIRNFCVSLNESDKMRLIDSDSSLVEQVRMAICEGWDRGIHNESDYYSSHQFKLRGFPFASYGSDHIYACVMMTFVLNAIEMKGFRLLCSADVSGKYVSNDNNHHTLDLHSWFFQN